MLLPIGISLYTVLDCCWLQFVRVHHALCSRPVRCSRVSLRPVSWCSVQDNRSRLQGNRLLSDPGTRLFGMALWHRGTPRTLENLSAALASENT